MDKAIETPYEGHRELQRLFIAGGLTIPTDIKERLEIIAFDTPSPVDAIIEFSELVYARADELPPEILELAAQTATVAAVYDFHGFRSKDNRGYGIANELRKKPGVKSLKPAPSKFSKPEPSLRYHKDVNNEPEPPVEAVPPAPAPPAPAKQRSS